MSNISLLLLIVVAMITTFAGVLVFLRNAEENNISVVVRNVVVLGYILSSVFLFLLACAIYFA